MPWLNYVTITDPEAIEPFAEFGIILLLFSIGLELSFSRLWSDAPAGVRARRGRAAASRAALIGVALLAMMGQSWTGAVGLGLALALSSTALVLPIVGTQSPVGRAALAMLLFEDVALVPIIFLLGALAPYAGDDGVGGLVTTMLVGGAGGRRACWWSAGLLLPATVRPGGADQEPRAVPRRPACWW